MTFGEFYSRNCGKNVPEKDLVRLCWIEAQKSAMDNRYHIALSVFEEFLDNTDGGIRPFGEYCRKRMKK